MSLQRARVEALRETVSVRDERADDHAAVDALVEAAFGQPGERDLVRALRGEPGVLSLVAVAGSEVVGHALYSPMTLAGHTAIGLAPLAVRPDWHGRSVGTLLCFEGRERWKHTHELCFVLGDPAYYGTRGWTTAAPRWRCKWPGTEAAFQVDFADRARAEHFEGGPVAYHPVFDGV